MTIALSDFRFSVLGIAYLVMLMAPNILWARLRNEKQTSAAVENGPLVFLERLGQVGMTVGLLFAPATPPPGPVRIALLVASLLALALYELAWSRYFRSPRTLADLYRALGPIPLALAILPVVGIALLALYEMHLVLLVCAAILGVGHISLSSQRAERAR